MSTVVRTCPACGHRLGMGRFCPNCGAATDPLTDPLTETTEPPLESERDEWRTDTAERPRHAAAEVLAEPPSAPPPEPRQPPNAAEAPPPARYPLYADEAAAAAPAAPDPEPAPGEMAAWQYDPEPEPAGWAEDEPSGLFATYETAEDERRSALPWVAVALAVLLVVAVGWWFLARDNGAGGPQSATDRSSASTGHSNQSPDSASSGQSGAPSGSASGASPSQPGGPPVDVAHQATAAAPRTAPQGQDVDGRPVAFDASNMLDGVTTAAWRAPGDGTGLELTFTLPGPTRVTKLGLINGYAKVSTDPKGRRFDWYHGNRRIESVVWRFDDGSTVPQQLSDDDDLQTVPVDGVVTRTVVLRLVSVSAPGRGRAGRDDTAVSEVSIVGAPG